MSWRTWGLGFLAGAALASWLTLSCAPGRAQSAEVAAAIHQAAVDHEVSEPCLRGLAWRESRFLPWATNARSGAAGAFQYLPSTWATLSRWAGYAGASPYDVWVAAQVTAYTIAHPWTGGLRHWGGWC